MLLRAIQLSKDQPIGHNKEVYDLKDFGEPGMKLVLHFARKKWMFVQSQITECRYILCPVMLLQKHEGYLKATMHQLIIFYRNLLIPTPDLGLPTASTRLAPIKLPYQYLNMVVPYHHSGAFGISAAQIPTQRTKMCRRHCHDTLTALPAIILRLGLDTWFPVISTVLGQLSGSTFNTGVRIYSQCDARDAI